jgi:hypothetical protein
MARSRDISKVLSSNTALATDAEVAATYQTKAAAGLTLISTTSFSAVASQSINDVFSATYDNYLIYFQGTGTTTNASLRLRMRVAGADNTSSEYSFATRYVDAGSSTGVTVSSGTTSLYLGDIYTRPCFTNIAISNTFLTDYTVYNSNSFNLFSTATSNTSIVGGGALTVTTSYTGFTIFPASGTITGSVSVFAYAK